MDPVVFTVGRFNPPTRGHDVLVRKLVEEATRLNASPMMFIVDGAKSGKDKNKNPLTGQQREYFIKKLFPGIQVEIIPSAYHAIEALNERELTPVGWIAGSDRAAKYRKLIASEQLECEVHEVNREAGEADGVSATAARKAALDGNMIEFAYHMPSDLTNSDLADIANMICEASNGKEDSGNISG
jgi:nicotinamide mononucleotide adenylyltransferase